MVKRACTLTATLAHPQKWNSLDLSGVLPKPVILSKVILSRGRLGSLPHTCFFSVCPVFWILYRLNDNYSHPFSSYFLPFPPLSSVIFFSAIPQTKIWKVRHRWSSMLNNKMFKKQNWYQFFFLGFNRFISLILSVRLSKTQVPSVCQFNKW